MDAGLIPKFVELLRSSCYRDVVLGILYHLSIEDAHKSLFTFTDANALVVQMLLSNSARLRNTPELVALTVNLANSSRNALAMCEGDGLASIVRAALQNAEPLLFKVLRNLCQHEVQVKVQLVPHVVRLVHVLKDPQTTSDLMVEVLGILGNMNVTEVDYGKLVQEHRLLPFISSLLQPGVVEDDILLEAVIFVGTLCTAGTAEAVADAGTVATLRRLHHLQPQQ